MESSGKLWKGVELTYGFSSHILVTYGGFLLKDIFKIIAR